MIGDETQNFFRSINLISGDSTMEEYLTHLPGYYVVRNKDLCKLKPGQVYIRHAPLSETDPDMENHIRKGGILVATGNMNQGKFIPIEYGAPYKYMMLKFTPSFDGQVNQKNMERFLRKQLKSENCFYYIKCQDHHLFAKNLKYSNDNIREIMLKLINKYQE
jgi:hypothetical protein